MSARQDQIDRFAAAIKAYDDEYARVEALWRKKQADIMELLCPAQGKEMQAAHNELWWAEPADGKRIGLNALLERARELVGKP